MMETWHAFLLGMLTTAALVAAAFFLRFWILTADRLFAFFALAFVALALNWLALAATDPASDSRYHVYLLRLLAFSFIIFAIVDKNRRAKRLVSRAG